MVLTHLILNDMVKVKGQISEMATCIVDPEERIASLAKLFFFELSKKVSFLGFNESKTGAELKDLVVRQQPAAIKSHNTGRAGGSLPRGE